MFPVIYLYYVTGDLGWLYFQWGAVLLFGNPTYGIGVLKCNFFSSKLGGTKIGTKKWRI